MSNLLQFPALIAEPQGRLFSEAEASRTIDLPDSEARAAALDIRRSWIVEAPAGSGKTGLLIQRYLKLLAHGGVARPGEVLAITFTRKAAAELRSRVLEQLTAALERRELAPGAGEFERRSRRLAEDVLLRDSASGWRLLDSPQQLNIRTIDSFCAELAGNMPVLSAGAGSRSPIEDASPLYELAAERTLRELGGEDRVLDEALRCVLLHRDANISDCTRLFADMLKQREQWGELVPLAPTQLTDAYLDTKVRRKLERTLERVISSSLARASKALGPELLRELTECAYRLAREPGNKGKVSPIAFCAQLPRAPEPQAEHIDHWKALLGLLLTEQDTWRVRLSSNDLKFQIPKEEAIRLKDVIARVQSTESSRPGLQDALCALRCLPPARYPEPQWRVVKMLFRVLRRALAELQVLFAERNTCDFVEIALAARSLLRHPDAEIKGGDLPGMRLTHLLVDEMQDTSAGQYELIGSLTRSWDGRTQTLFLVGDPKQSIYAFRQARVERFLNTLTGERLGDVPLGALRLTANFRSQAELVQAFNETFSLILPRPEHLPETSGAESGAVPFVAATPSRAAGARPAFHWHPAFDGYVPAAPLSEDEDAEDRPARSADEDARTIRNVIEEFLQQWRKRSREDGVPQRAPQIAVLARNRAHLAPVIAEFHRDRGDGPLPFRAVDVEVLSERPEVLDLVALTRALLHPADRVAWLAVLHSPVCGLGLADLLALTGQDEEAERAAIVAHLVATRREHLSPEGQTLLDRAWPVLAGAQQDLGRTRFGTHIERTWRSLGGDAPLQADERKNAGRFLHLLHELEDGSEPLSLALLERRLRSLYAEAATADAAVELMTIHKAKGLEWDLVLVPGLERGSGTSQHDLLKWHELNGGQTGEAEVILAPIHEKGDDMHPLSAWLNGLQRSREAAECRRLFYVACTRAREEVHLFGACIVKKNGELRPGRHDSLLNAAWAAAEPVFRQHASAQGTVDDKVGDEQGTTLVSRERNQPLALAAAADIAELQAPAGRTPTLHRLPPGFDPLARFRPENGPQLRYPAAATLKHAASFVRPEGSFAARAFGNAVHRYLQLIASYLEAGKTADDLEKEVVLWEPRLRAVLRSEGLAAADAQRQAGRAVRALVASLQDPIGRWVLAPRAGARTERTLISSASQPLIAPVNALRADRTFFAGAAPLVSGNADYLWIIDYKTAELGGRDPKAFLADQQRKYLPQMEAYAAMCAPGPGSAAKIVLALYFPLLKRLKYWRAAPVEPCPEAPA